VTGDLSACHTKFRETSVTVDEITEAVKGQQFEITQTNPSKDQEANLRADFGEWCGANQVLLLSGRVKSRGCNLERLISLFQDGSVSEYMKGRCYRLILRRLVSP